MSAVEEYHYDDEAAERFVQFCTRKLKHVKGELAGKPLLLEPWQLKIVRDIFGWKRADGTRRYRTAYIEVGRKNGKSTMCAAIALYLLLCDGQLGPEVISAAGTRDQARIVFEVCKGMIEQDKDLQDVARVMQYRIIAKRANGYYTAVSSDAPGKHGGNINGIIFDELHVQPNRELWDVLTTGVGARPQPLTVAITTAGYDRSTICWELHQRAKAALAEPDSDPYFYPVIYAAEPDEDWTDEAVWRKANPSLGVSLKLDYLREACREAQKNPVAENTFRRLHLCQWTQTDVRWLPMHQWDAAKSDFEAADMAGQTCWAGLDLASTRDANAFVLVFKLDERYRLLPFFWAPESLDQRGEQDRRQFMNYAKHGYVKLTTAPGVVDYEVILQDILALCKEYRVQFIQYDPWGPARVMRQRLESSGLPGEMLLECGQSMGKMACPTKEFETLLASGKIEHNGNPLLRWMAENAVVKPDSNGNIKPDKGKSGDKIDGIVAAIMGLDLAMAGEIREEESWYTPGILTA